LIFYVESAEVAGRVAAALQAENIDAARLYEPDVTDYHVYVHWTPITHRRTWHPAASPWRNAHSDVDYSPAACPRTLDLLARAIHLDVNPLLSNQELELILEGLEKVLTAMT
ncbi:MAG TPA: glutamine--scyllo-inositol aminotransferase, partial [Chloroflexi bacterium]|nr:glutamine--scyllo-inositol aminotransferase [Chloroflexota bacterium]